MKTVGIIAEYNPFHNGHQYHLEQAKTMTGSDYVIVLMSGDFTQRGAPAVIDKYARAQMALESGADLVLELPLCYACSSAEFFAKGAVCLLDKLGVVNSLCFGSECGDIALLSRIAGTLLEEPAAFTLTLKKCLKEGMTYPQARTKALLQAMGNTDGLADVLAAPNNILGIEYCKALMEMGSRITPYTNLRIGSSYHDSSLSGNKSSAAAVRQIFEQNSPLSLLQDQVPPGTYSLLQSQFLKTFPVFTDDFSSLLKYKLLIDAPHGYTAYADVSKDLSHRIQNNLHRYTCFTEFCTLLKTRDVTYTRISRCLLHILLDIKQENMKEFCHFGYIFYARMLGFCKKSQILLSSVKKNASIPLISKLADAKQQLADAKTALAMLQSDIQASHIYDTVANDKFKGLAPNEYARNIILK